MQWRMAPLISFFLAILWATSGQVSLNLDTNRIHHLMATEEGGAYILETTGSDPWIWTLPLETRRPAEATILSFEYFSPAGLDHLQVFPGEPSSEKRSVKLGQVGLSEGWTTFHADLGKILADWGAPGEVMRLDFGGKPGVNMQIRNIQLRTRTAREQEIAGRLEEQAAREARFDAQLTDYLANSFSSKISHVNIAKDKLTISGDLSGSRQALLCEIAPFQPFPESLDFLFSRPVSAPSFEVELDRYIDLSDMRYDRALSRWVLMKSADEGSQILSHARYPDQIHSAHNLPEELPAGRKGLGGFSARRGHVEDLDALDITSATVNIWISGMMFSQPGEDRIAHRYQNKNYYFDRRRVEQLDETLRATAERNIVVGAILLIRKAEDTPDPEIGRLLQHPDMDPSGLYSMPNMTTPESVQCYAAALDFLASRYSRPDMEFGRIHHWIMHNEVDAGWVWTNMGDKTANIFMDAYLKSMRMCHAIARQYNPHSEVLISLTHHWAWTSHPKFYPSRDLLDILLDCTRAEGDFEWGVAYHPYPESLFEPKTWLDEKAQFNIDTPLITFKNLEVLDYWIKQPENLYQGSRKRTLWLSENGTNSKTYSEQDLKEQAAGFAYTWKKMERLDGIDGFQWHNWYDNRGEGGLRLGLRRFPDDPDDPGGRKPVWYVYEAAGTEREAEVFDPYKEIIGIEDWNEIHQPVEVK